MTRASVSGSAQAVDRSVFDMIDVEFTSEELALVHHAVSAFLSEFGHKQADVVHQLRDLLGKIPSPVQRIEYLPHQGGRRTAQLNHHLHVPPAWRGSEVRPTFPKPGQP